MKLQIFTIITFLAVINAQRHCSMLDVQYLVIRCDGIELSPQKQLHFSSVSTKLRLTGATGSIGLATFSEMPQLTEVSTNSSGINHIEAGAFSSLPNLDILKLQSIAPSETFAMLTKSILSSCSKVTYLVLGNVQMESDALSNMGALAKLELHQCKIDKFEAGVICLSPKLGKLVLDSNKFPWLRKGLFENCNNVKELQYRSHDSVRLQEGAFSGFENLGEAYLTNLNIRNLRKGYLTGLSNVDVLKISQSNVVDIAADTFTDFGNLRNLDLSHNKIYKLDSHLISSIPKLITLSLAGNRLTSIENIIGSNYFSLNVSSNNITHINPIVVFKNIPHLFYLNMNCNPLTKENLELIRGHTRSITFTYGVYPCFVRE